MFGFLKVMRFESAHVLPQITICNMLPLRKRKQFRFFLTPFLQHNVDINAFYYVKTTV